MDMKQAPKTIISLSDAPDLFDPDLDEAP